MLYLSAGDAGDHGLTTALLDVLANGFAIVALVAKHLCGIAVDSCINAGTAVTSWAWPGVITMPMGRPSALVRALILVEKPPRERPSALRSAPPFRRRRNDAHARWSYQSSAMSCRPSRCRRAPPASHPRCHCQPSGGIAEKSNSSCRTPPADPATARRSASTKTSRPSHGDGCAADGQRDGSETVRNTPTHHRSTVRESKLPSAKSSLESILDSCVNRFVHAT